MKRKRIVIADITSLKSGNQGFGHFFHVADMYTEIFESTFDVYIAGGPVYETKFMKLIKLQYDVDLKEYKHKVTKFFTKIKELLNAKQVLKNEENECIIFQHYSNIILFLSILMFKSKNKIFIIQYKNEIKSFMRRILFLLIKKKISGIIVSKDSIGKEYKIPYIVIPDYIYLGKESISDGVCTYDYGVFGIIRKGKDVVGVAKLFVESNLKLIIAGSIQDATMKSELDKIALASPNITLINRYLPENEYDSLISKTKCVILPYTGCYYNESSSGVVFDILFRKKPVITRNYEFFKFVEDESVGVLFENLNDIDLNSLIEDNKYREIQSNIQMYLEKNSKMRIELMEFIGNCK